MVIFRNQWDGKRVVRKGELIAWRAEFDWTAEEALELRQPRVARQSKGHLSRLKLSAGHFAQSFDRGGNYKFGVPPGEVPRKANKCGLDDHIFERPVYLQTLNFIADAATASGQRQRVAAIQDRDGATLGLTASASASIGSNSSGPMAATTPARSNAVAAQPPLRVEIVKHPDDSSGFILLPHRWIVERTFSWFGRNRRLAKDYENLADTLAAFITLACIQIAVSRLARP